MSHHGHTDSVGLLFSTILIIICILQVSEEGFWYDQDEHEFVLVLQGAARLVLELSGRMDGGGAEGAPISKVLDLKPGDWTFLPAHCRHRVAWTDPDVVTVWLAVFWSPGLAPSHN